MLKILLSHGVKLNLVQRHNAAGTLVFSLHRGFRVFFLLFAGFLVAVLVTSYDPADSNTGPLILIIGCLLFGFYNEAWIFDATAREIQQQHGMLFLFKRKIISMDDLESVRLSRFVKGEVGMAPKETDFQKKRFFQPTYQKLSLITKDGKGIVIEILKTTQQEILEEKAKAIVSVCQLPLIYAEDDFS